MEKMLQMGMDGNLEQLEYIVQESKKLTVTMFALYILREAKEHEDCDATECNVIKRIPEAVENFIAEVSEDIRVHIKLNLEANGINVEKTVNENVRDAILKQLKASGS